MNWWLNSLDSNDFAYLAKTLLQDDHVRGQKMVQEVFGALGAAACKCNVLSVCSLLSDALDNNHDGKVDIAEIKDWCAHRAASAFSAF